MRGKSRCHLITGSTGAIPTARGKGKVKGKSKLKGKGREKRCPRCGCMVEVGIVKLHMDLRCPKRPGVLPVSKTVSRARRAGQPSAQIPDAPAGMLRAGFSSGQVADGTPINNHEGSRCTFSRSKFKENAKPIEIKIDDMVFPALPIEFSTGGFGWYIYGKGTIKASQEVYVVINGIPLIACWCRFRGGLHGWSIVGKISLRVNESIVSAEIVVKLILITPNGRTFLAPVVGEAVQVEIGVNILVIKSEDA